MEPNLLVRVLASIGLYGPCVFLKGYNVIFLSVFGAVVIIALLWDQSQLICCLSAEEFDKETGQVLCGMDKLPPDLRQYVKDDNELFENEMKEWDILQALKAQQEKPPTVATAATSASAACSIITSPASPQSMSVKSSPPEGHGQGNHFQLYHMLT